MAKIILSADEVSSAAMKWMIVKGQLPHPDELREDERYLWEFIGTGNQVELHIRVGKTEKNGR